MKLSKVILPEIAMGKRESHDLGFDKRLREILGDFIIDNGVLKFHPDRVPLIPEGQRTIYLASYSLVKRATLEKWKNYHICHDFCEALRSLRDREINKEFMPDSFEGYISFPSDLKWQKFKNIFGAYVYIGKSDESTPFMPENYGKRVFWCTIFCEAEEGIYTNALNFYFDDIKHIHEVPEAYTSNGWPKDDFTADRTAAGNLILNTILYLNSQDPELLALKPSWNAPVSKQRSHTVNGHLNQCTLPVIAINWDYKKIYRYEEHESFVDTHLAWRRCGPNFSQLRLTWIKEHTRKYQKKTEEVINERD